MMKVRIGLVGVGVLLSLFALPEVASAGPSSAVAKAASRALVRRSAPRVGALLARDLRNHRTARVVRLAAPRTVFRYTSLQRARGAIRRGIPAMRHLTSRGGAGRPLGSVSAARALGLSRRPAARLTVRVPKRQPVIFNRIVGGGAGRGEIVSPKRIPAAAVKRVVRVR